MANMGTYLIYGGNLLARNSRAISQIEKVLPYTVSHPDIKLVELEDGKKNISIEQARNIIEEIFIKPVSSSRKFIWIKEAQRLTTEAQNALLKVLEEPPYSVEIILTANNKRGILPTIISRAYSVELKSLSEVNISSDEHNQFASDFLKLLRGGLGERLDWVSSLKDKSKDDVPMEVIFSSWESVLSDLIISSAGETNVMNLYLQKDLKDFQTNNEHSYAGKLASISDSLIKTKKAILLNNVNRSLGLESFLVNISVFR